MKQLLGFFFTLIGKAENQYLMMKFTRKDLEEFKIVLKKLSRCQKSD